MPLCIGDVLQLGSCDQTTDEWHYYESGYFSGLALGPDYQFMACWDTGTGWEGPYKADGEPLRKIRFDAATEELGCGWWKVEA